MVSVPIRFAHGQWLTRSAPAVCGMIHIKARPRLKHFHYSRNDDLEKRGASAHVNFDLKGWVWPLGEATEAGEMPCSLPCDNPL